MPKFNKEKKVLRAQAGAAPGQGSKPEEVPQWIRSIFAPAEAGTDAYNRAIEGLKKSWSQSGNLKLAGSSEPMPPIRSEPNIAAADLSSVTQSPSRSLPSSQRLISGPAGRSIRQAQMPSKRAPIPNSLGGEGEEQQLESLNKTGGASSADRDTEAFAQMAAANPDRMKIMALRFPGLLTSSKGGEGEEQELESLNKTGGASSAAAAIPKTKAGMKKFMQDYGKFIALGAMAGAGGKGGQIAAPIIAALPGLIEMMKGKGKAATAPAPKAPAKDTGNYKKGGAIRKFKGGSMDKSKGNTKDSMLTPKYKKGGSIGEIPQHKKMAMGKPTPQSTGQKFAKGGTMKCATGGGVKGYGIAKKIRPTGPMN